MERRSCLDNQGQVVRIAGKELSLMPSQRRPAPQSTVPRLARSYQAVTKVPFDSSIYPAQVNSIAPSIHDLRLCQGLLANEQNFALQTSCDLFELHQDGAGSWRYRLNDAQLVDYVKGQENHRVSSSAAASVPSTSAPTPASKHVKMRAIFITTAREEKTSFGYQLSVTRPTLQTILNRFRVTPQFCPFMLGEPDYWAPLDMQRRDAGGMVEAIEFVCQQPRYAIRSKQQLCSLYMGFDSKSASATYIVISGKDEPYLDRVKCRLSDYFPSGGTLGATTLHPKDPFLLLSMICHESLVDAKAIVTELRHRLYDQLDIVDMYSESPFDRSNLRELTNQLHKVSQDVDSLFASAEMGTMIIEHVIRARDRALHLFPRSLSEVNVDDSLFYVKQSLESQKRWLLSYKARKDIAMNLVFNLVTQQDSETNTAIARDTKDDSASMKIIALLTMIFLPATTVSSFFGMAFFSPGPGGSFETSSMWWLFVAATLPLTLVTLSLWWLWYPVSRYLTDLSNWNKARRMRQVGNTCQDEEKGSVDEIVGVSVSVGSKSLH